MSADRIAQLARIATELRYYFSVPAARLRQEPLPTVPEFVAISAALRRQKGPLVDEVRAFCSGDLLAYGRAITDIIGAGSNHTASRSRDLLGRAVGEQALRDECRVLADYLDQLYENADRILRQVPVDQGPFDFGRGDRLAATLFLTDLIKSARTRVDIVDRYLDDTMIHFMADLPRELSIQMITTHGSEEGRYGVVHLRPFAQVARQQYARFRLLQVHRGDLHMRCVRVDDRFVRFDQSIRGLSLHEGAHFPALNDDPEGHGVLDALIAGATEVDLQDGEFDQ